MFWVLFQSRDYFTVIPKGSVDIISLHLGQFSIQYKLLDSNPCSFLGAIEISPNIYDTEKVFTILFDYAKF